MNQHTWHTNSYITLNTLFSNFLSYHEDYLLWMSLYHSFMFGSLCLYSCKSFSIAKWKMLTKMKYNKIESEASLVYSILFYSASYATPIVLEVEHLNTVGNWTRVQKVTCRDLVTMHYTFNLAIGIVKSFTYAYVITSSYRWAFLWSSFNCSCIISFYRLETDLGKGANAVLKSMAGSSHWRHWVLHKALLIG